MIVQPKVDFFEKLTNLDILIISQPRNKVPNKEKLLRQAHSQFLLLALAKPSLVRYWCYLKPVERLATLILEKYSCCSVLFRLTRSISVIFVKKMEISLYL